MSQTQRAAGDPAYHWIPIDAHTPQGEKLQLIDRAAGVAVYGVLPGAGWTHWQRLPTFAKDTP